MRAVNLIPPERRGGKRSTPRVREPLLPVSIFVAVLAVGAVGYLAHSTSSTVSHRRATVQQLDEQLAKLTAAQQAEPTGATTSRVAAATTIAGQRVSWDGFLNSLSRVVPEDVWLLNLSATGTGASSAPSPAPAPAAAAPTGVTFTGYTYSQPSVARMMRRLALVPWLQNVSLVSSTKTSMANQTVYQFTLGANFVGLPEVGT
jgi:Tfp pilus assembly protein PilN